MFKAKNIFVFFKAQFSAFIGGIVDYLIMIVCTEFLHIHYTMSILVGGLIGAVINFSINRHWTFSAQQNQSAMPLQFFKFACMLGGSIFLKASGTFLLTESVHIDYKISRLMTDVVVSLGFNYTLQKYWVFSRKTDV